MNLVLDFGNSTTKIALFENKELLEKIIVDFLDERTLNQILEKYPSPEKAILSAVSDYPKEIADLLNNILPFYIELDHKTPLPIQNNYLSKISLGYDRIAGVVAAHNIFPDSNVLVIDAGTAITFDLITAEGVFTGGNISPGMTTRAKALNKFTKKLPLINFQNEYVMMGRNTEEAIISGIINGILFEIEGYISRLQNDYKDLKIILTGGDAKYFDKKLKSFIFVDSDLNLKGLDRILEYNAQKK